VSEGPNDPRIELLRAAQSAVERRDREAFGRATERLMHPDGEWKPLLAAVEGGRYVGPEGALAFYDDFLGAFEARYAPFEYRTVGDDIMVTLTTLRARGRGSDAEVERELGTIYEFEGNRVRLGRVYDSHAAAIAAAQAIAGTESTHVRSAP
jgi:SnoaL-like domain